MAGRKKMNDEDIRKLMIATLDGHPMTRAELVDTLKGRVSDASVTIQLSVLAFANLVIDRGVNAWKVYALADQGPAADARAEALKAENPSHYPSPEERVAKAVAAKAITQAEGDAWLGIGAKIKAGKPAANGAAAPAPAPVKPNLPGVKGGAQARK